MKYIISAMLLLMIGCSGDPMISPQTPQTKWIDAVTHGDTIITNVGGSFTILYYAIKDWHSFPDSNFAYGFRQIAVKAGDSVLVKPLNDISTNYNGPYLLKLNVANDSLEAQNFLDSIHTTSAVLYVRQH
jgi:hypothetical protein